VNRINRGLLATAEAILCGRRGDPAAAPLVSSARNDLARYPVWRELAQLFAAEAGQRDGWGEPGGWLAEAAEGFTRHGFGELAARCTAMASAPAERWAGLGITSREAEVLGLIADGLANKQIAERLTLSVRTVEKHVESLLRKTGCASRTQLVALVRS
jgi:DNA-binding CsgD family transcriptional regulator